MLTKICVKCQKKRIVFSKQNPSVCAICEIPSKNKVMKKYCISCNSLTDNFLNYQFDSVCIDCELSGFRSLGQIPEKVTIDDIRELARETGRQQSNTDRLRSSLGSTYCSSPGCFTKLKNRYSVICSYCKSKQGYYK
jgi:hypothetical protein